MTKRDYPKEISQDEWLKRQNYFLEEQNRRLKSELAESKEYINVLINKLKLYQSKQYPGDINDANEYSNIIFFISPNPNYHSCINKPVNK